MRVPLAMAAALIVTACARREPLPVLGIVPTFEFTDQSGRMFPGSELRGHAWVADFIYTTCPGPCPRMSSRMRELQDSTPPAVQMVSFTVDPDTDTPQVLSAYARRFGADLHRWHFLTGAKDSLSSLARDGFRLAGGTDHSTYFALVDRQGRIRGYYGMAEGSPVARIAAALKGLEEEN